MTDDRRLPASRPPRGRYVHARFAVAFLLGVALVVGVGGAGLYAYGRQYDGRVLPGVRAGAADLSGLSPAQASAAIADAYGHLADGRITLRGPDGDHTIRYRDIARGPDTTAMIERALAAGRGGEAVADLIGAPQTALRGATVHAAVTYDRAKLEAAVAAVAEAIDRPAVDATLAVGKDVRYTTTDAVAGRVVDRPALLAELDRRLTRLDAPADLALDLPLRDAEPAVTDQDVRDAIATADRMSADLVLARGGDTWTISGRKLRRLISFAASGADGSLVPVVDEAGIDALLKPVAKAVNRAPANARFGLKGSRVVVAAKAKEGRKLDLAGTHAAVLAELMARQGGSSTNAPIAPVVAASQPAVTTEQARAIAPRMQPLKNGRHTTWFHIYERNGFGANIWIPAKLINGYVVGPGETFDFWKAVGPVTREKGYKDGGAIINGKTEPQGALAGGICSCSTTLFNAALKGGYQMGARRNHYYYIDRYPVGLDATVFMSGSGSVQTMSWTNDTKYPVLIRGINTRKGGIGYVTFQLYSVPNGRKVVLGAPVIKNKRQAKDSVQLTSTLKPGQTKRVEFPVDGFDVWRTVSVYEHGQLLRRKTYYSHYATITGILLKGKGTTPPASPTPAPTATPAP